MTRRPTAGLGRRSVLALGLGASTTLAAGCSPTPSASQEVGYAQGDGSFTIIEPDKRRSAPVLTGRNLAGDPLTSGGRAGKVLVLNVWGSWCSPCRKEAPDLAAAAQQTAAKAQFLGINTRDTSPQAAQAFCREFGITYPNFWDPDGELLLQFTQLPPKAIPSTLVIDTGGRLAARVLGAASTSTLVKLVHDVVGSA